MKLPDFEIFEPFNSLRKKMKAPLIETSEFKQSINRLSVAELEVLASKGIDIAPEEIIVLDDGTLAYKDRRVVIYIRDVSHFGQYNTMPKFHLVNCKTLQDMRSKGKFSKYVGSIRTDGIFEVNKISSGKKAVNQHLELDVCKNCLSHLDYKQYSRNKYQVFNNFSLEEFFEEYPTDFLSTPMHSSATSPLNTYADDWYTISQNKKERVNWHCEKCNIDLRHPSHRRFLHVHHVDGRKENNHSYNLKALCIKCHSEEPMHGHMKAMPDLKEFEGIFLKEHFYEAS